MRIIADTREQRVFSFAKYEAEVERAALPTADYSLPGFEDRVGIERKELGDLVACLMGANRQRFEKELRRLSAYELKAVVVEAVTVYIALLEAKAPTLSSTDQECVRQEVELLRKGPNFLGELFPESPLPAEIA